MLTPSKADGAQAAGPGLRTDNSIRIGIVGAGLMGRWHAYTALRLGARIVGIVDPDSERARKLVRSAPQAEIAVDLKTLLEHQRVDAVHICTPLSTHLPLAREAIRMGVHTLVEKPLAVSARETETLLEAAERAGIIICPVHQVTFQDSVLRIAAALDGLGSVCSIAFNISSAGGRGLAESELNHVIADILPHPLSILRALWPREPLDSDRWRTHHPRSGELLLSGEHAGALLSVLISMHARPICFDLVIQGSGGTACLDLFHGYVITHGGGVSRLRKVTRPFSGATKTLVVAAKNLGRRGLGREPAYPGLRTLVRRFYEAIAQGAAPPITADDAMKVAVARDAVVEQLSRKPTARHSTGESTWRAAR